jgi:hypothetical protein
MVNFKKEFRLPAIMASNSPLVESLSAAFLKELSRHIGPIEAVPELEDLLTYSQSYLNEPRQGAAMVGIAKKFSDLGRGLRGVDRLTREIYRDTLLFIYRKVDNCYRNVDDCTSHGNIIQANAAECCEATAGIIFDKTKEKPLVMRLLCSRGKETENKITVPLAFNLSRYGRFSRDVLATSHYAITSSNIPDDKRTEYFALYAFRMGVGMSPEEASSRRFSEIQANIFKNN